VSGGGGGEGVAGAEEMVILMSLFAAKDSGVSVTVTWDSRPSAEISLSASCFSFFGLRAASAAA